MVIHNAEFDIGHLNNELLILNKNKIKNEIVDTLEKLEQNILDQQ